ncbi:SEC-C metal-binding domain-containing protein [Siphonobacter sp. SORGH_AS_1065]|uniref:SEC-C metal-binding domain-containing protein n=1 Tax=Siphonobacter sp. SORGH_AS_1065 TaxID=3041795 RepID=UPI002787EE51|nr:SEC-C metal-binding domain-containing protein [Siphonobacter sp. SORGH_AS_1065]MDQ1086768.1 hypothetical protein [Siphonobacter sp. SORGH_AS_1065]
MSEGLNIFQQEAICISDHFPTLRYGVMENGHPYVISSIELRDENGDIIDLYRIKIVPTKDYPYRFPLVYEIEGRIPINIDWHLFPDGHCCIKAQTEEILICSNAITLIDFINIEIIPYFFNQKHRELYGYFIDERPHGQKGNLEFLYEIFKTRNKLIIEKCLVYIAKKEEPNRVGVCFCGSGKKYRKCHRDTYKLLS